MKHETTTHETVQNKYFCYNRWFKICFCFCIWWKLRVLIVSVRYFNSQPVPWPEGAALLPLDVFRWDSLFWRWSGRGAGEQQQNKLNLWGCVLTVTLCCSVCDRRREHETQYGVWTLTLKNLFGQWYSVLWVYNKKKMLRLRDESQFREGVLRRCGSICSPIKCLENSWFIHFKKTTPQRCINNLFSF